MIVALGTTIISCSKEEPSVTDVAETLMTNQVEKEKYPLTIPNTVTYVTIKWIKPEGSDHLPPEGVVITNLRYRLAK